MPEQRYVNAVWSDRLSATTLQNFPVGTLQSPSRSFQATKKKAHADKKLRRARVRNLWEAWMT
jgi:hypothetical protein